jgi:hypothetical protein
MQIELSPAESFYTVRMNVLVTGGTGYFYRGWQPPRGQRVQFRSLIYRRFLAIIRLLSECC